MKINIKKVLPIGTKLAFVTRSCCGPDGKGPCQAHREGLRCGVGYIPVYPDPEPGEVKRGKQLRELRRSLGLTLGDVSKTLGIDLTDASELERGAATVDNWDELYEALKSARRN